MVEEIICQGVSEQKVAGVHPGVTLTSETFEGCPDLRKVSKRSAPTLTFRVDSRAVVIRQGPLGIVELLLTPACTRTTMTVADLGKDRRTATTGTWTSEEMK